MTARCADAVRMWLMPNSLCALCDLCVNIFRFMVHAEVAESAELMIAVTEKLSKTIS